MTISSTLQNSGLTRSAYSGPGLQRVLNLLRGGPKSGKYVLVVKEPFKRWVLGRLPADRGQPVEIINSLEFTNLIEAEWEVFKLRWKANTGQDLEQEL